MVFPNAQKGRKGEKEMGILNDKVGVQGPEERECRRESEIPGPLQHFRVVSSGSTPLTNRNVIHKMLFVKCFCQKNFLTILARYS